MEPAHLLVVYFLAALSASVLLAQGKDEAGVTEDAITEDQRKVHQECRNPDYKQYVKCLMRPKRHHRGDVPSETVDRPPKLQFPSLTIIPQISLVPQITYGIGAAGGCAYNQWLCTQQTNVQVVQVDVSHWKLK
ncbi:hypothetical protein DMN91_006281 [Ooceraea biroi]|uniref:Uncharacterized protein n=1 Tax=Ooceraea biroi TaxID=2015173 RepID=A0A3L8DNU9_OOCBI|nr:hypothetical protein DMN91_006281 [Ooceraea biroi]